MYGYIKVSVNKGQTRPVQLYRKQLQKPLSNQQLSGLEACRITECSSLQRRTRKGWYYTQIAVKQVFIL